MKEGSKSNSCNLYLITLITVGIRKLDMSGFQMVDMAIRNPDYSKTGHFFSLDRFIKNEKIVFFIKWSRLNHSKSGPKSPVFEWSISLDRFICKEIFFHI